MKSKGDSLNRLYQSGMNTPRFVVSRKPFNREDMIFRLIDFDGKISIRTWRKDGLVCPFFPNRPKSEVPDILDELFSMENLDEIILAEGINPEESLACGRASHMDDDSIILEFFRGSGTVRDLDKKNLDEVTCLVVSRHKALILGEDDWIRLLLKQCREFYKFEPGTTLEWSYYKGRIGWKKENLIFWEALGGKR